MCMREHLTFCHKNLLSPHFYFCFVSSISKPDIFSSNFMVFTNICDDFCSCFLKFHQNETSLLLHMCIHIYVYKVSRRLVSNLGSRWCCSVDDLYEVHMKSGFLEIQRLDFSIYIVPYKDHKKARGRTKIRFQQP